MTGQTYDHERIHINLARLKKEGHVFEIVVEPDLAIQLKDGKNIDIRDVLKSEEIFTDAKKGTLASQKLIEATIGTGDSLEAAKRIIKEGEIQLTSQYRQKVRDEKRKRIIEFIHRNGVDPRTHAPHPITRIESALDEAKIRIDENKPEEKQIREIVKKLLPILPIKFEIKEIQIVIPPAYAAKMYPIVKSFGKMLKDEWEQDGSWLALIEMPAGMEMDLIDKLNSKTHGNVEIKTVKTKQH